MSLTESGPAAIVDLHRTLSSDNQFDYSSYQFKSIDPRIGLEINEPLVVSETKLDFDAPVTTKDGAHGVVSGSVLYSIQCLVTLSGRDIPTTNYEVELAATYAISLDELVSFVERYRIPEELKNIRRKLGFWQYLGGLIFRNEQGQVFLVSSILKEDIVGMNGILRSPNGTSQVRGVSYSLLSWDQLFQ